MSAYLINIKNYNIMGCHTWFAIPVIESKEEIIKLAKDFIQKHYKDTDYAILYQYAIKNELMSPVCDLASSMSNTLYFKEYPWTLFNSPVNVSIDEYNKKNNTNYTSIWKIPEEDKHLIETYSDEPRIGGYPDRIITSYKDMLDFMKTGFTNEDSQHFNFYYKEERYDKFMLDIKTFFKKYPKGIIHFN